MPVGIVGGRGSGKTVFVSLLAQSAIDYSNETSGRDFRYYTDPEFTEVVGDVYRTMNSHEWPAATHRSLLSRYNFYFGFSPNFLIKGIAARMGKPKFNVLRFNLFDIAGEDVEAVRYATTQAEKTQKDPMDLLPDTLKQVLDSSVLVFLIDAASLTSTTEEKRKAMLEYDQLMADLLSLVATYKARNAVHGKVPKIYPVFVLTKFDRVEPEVLDALGFPKNLVEWLKDLRERKGFLRNIGQKERNQSAEKLVKQFLRHTSAIKYGARLKNVNLDESRFFFSFVNTDRDELGMLVPKLVQIGKGTASVLDYSDTEYRSMIDFFGEIAKEIRDKESETVGAA